MNDLTLNDRTLSRGDTGDLVGKVTRLRSGGESQGKFTRATKVERTLLTFVVWT